DWHPSGAAPLGTPHLPHIRRQSRATNYHSPAYLWQSSRTRYDHDHPQEVWNKAVLLGHQSEPRLGLPILTSTAPCCGTDAENESRKTPRSFCCHRSRTGWLPATPSSDHLAVTFVASWPRLKRPTASVPSHN